MDYKELTYLGLSEKEAKVYLSSLELGKSSAQKIAEKSKVNRATTYVQIESLTKKGLMSSYTEGKKQFFCAEAPEKLELIFRQQIEQIEYNRNRLKDILPELRQIDNKNQDKPVVRYFEGKNGIRAMVEDMFNVKKGTEILMMYPYDDIERNFTSKELDDWRAKRLKGNVDTRALYTRSFGPADRAPVKSKRIRVSIDKYPLKSDIAIYENRIRIASLNEKKMIGIIIEDKEAADTLRSIFELAWKAANQEADYKK
jgi:sugar-specific transcriptional regulator TrmB